MKQNKKYAITMTIEEIEQVKEALTTRLNKLYANGRLEEAEHTRTVLNRVIAYYIVLTE